jgi:hypothetical protein
LRKRAGGAQADRADGDVEGIGQGKNTIRSHDDCACATGWSRQLLKTKYLDSIYGMRGFIRK